MTEATLNTESQTLKNLYDALDKAIASEQADLINVLSSAIQRLR
jgi:hypothetical protein